MLRRRYLDLWLPSYLRSAPARALGRLRQRGQLTHIVFLVCDHFEPRHGAKNNDQPFERMQAWQRGYAQFQARCRAEFGAVPLHTWFYPPHHGAEHLASLADMVFDGLGEVELHYHHDGDTAESLTADLQATLSEYHRWGFLLNSGRHPKAAFGFIHGDWALNNSCDGKYCGVNNETDILASLGCWGDMTMPSANRCQTRKINSVYYADGDTSQPKSHDSGRDLEVGRTDPEGFFMLQGPLAINWRAPGYPRIENASLTSDNWGRPDRIRKWLDCQVHVRGRPDWLFVKLHTHGAIEKDFDALFGEKAMSMHRILNREYNDGKRYRLHYATARQAYNIAKAAEHGKSGDPSAWVDFILPPQPHSYYAMNAGHDLLRCEPDHLAITRVDAHADTLLRTRVGMLKSLRGSFHSVDVTATSVVVRAAPGARLVAQLGPNAAEMSVEGGGMEPGTVDGQWIVHTTSPATTIQSGTAQSHAA